MEYKDTLLWKKTLAPLGDQYETKRELLRDSYEQARKSISDILEKIRTDFPNLTLHDISHIDSLWHTASAIIGREDYPISPMEGYILGCAFLIHDAALCYEAYGGVTKLRETIEWKDCFAEITKSLTTDSREQKEYDADFLAIRFLHAKHSKTLLDKLFSRSDGSQYYIVENRELREHWGNLIGDIAASHHWDISDVQNLDFQKNTMTDYPCEWRINPQKLACLIRCADAAHIDSGRAPDYLFQVLKINSVSLDHWKAQNYLSQLDVYTADKHKLIITSTKEFKENDFAAWNVAYDAISVLNKELKASNALLYSIDPELCFQAREICGANSRKELSKYIKTIGWQPCEANIHISNVANLITNLGGTKLYGPDDHIVIVLRELIQNARDAIKARECYDKSFKGKIKILVSKEDDDFWITISDNGIGMSLKTLTTSLLDFGTSFWASDLAKQEFPGLRSSSFESVGRFGIGFYSIFMSASQVHVTSRKYDKGLDDEFTLKFPNGLTLTPIISQKRGTDVSISTIIKFKIDGNKYQWKPTYTIKRNVMGGSNFDVSFKDLLCATCAGLDTDVYYGDETTTEVLIHKNIQASDFDKKQWLKDISFAAYQNNVKLIEYIESNYQRLEYLEENGHIVGLAAVNTLYYGGQNFLSISAIGGLSSAIHSREGDTYIGYLDYEVDSAKRGISSKYVATDETLKTWAINQKELIAKNEKDRVAIHKLQYNLCAFKVDPIDITTVLCTDISKKRLLLPIDVFIKEIQLGKSIIILKSSFSSDYMEPNHSIDMEKIYSKLSSNDLFVIPAFNGNFLDIKIKNDIPENNYSLVDCIYRKAKTGKCDLAFSSIPNYAPSKFGINDALIITKK